VTLGFFGKLHLPPGTEILGSSKDLEGHHSHNARLVPMEGNVINMVRQRIMQRGYQLMTITAHSTYIDEENLDKYVHGELIKGKDEQIHWTYEISKFAQKYNSIRNAHYDSEWHKLEKEIHEAFVNLRLYDSYSEGDVRRLERIKNLIDDVKRATPVISYEVEEAMKHLDYIYRLLKRIYDYRKKHRIQKD
jgi:hypothetical protein